jgi:hypothetical protein
MTFLLPDWKPDLSLLYWTSTAKMKFFRIIFQILSIHNNLSHQLSSCIEADMYALPIT